MQDLVELEIKPGPLLAEYRELTAHSVSEFFPSATLVTASCPACGSDGSGEAFGRLGLTYRECSRCGTLFVSPRPDAAALERYYRDSHAAAFWRERVLSETAEARLDKLVLPRADWVIEGLAENAPGASVAVDRSVNGGPLRGLLEARGLRFRAAGPADLALAFDVLDRAADLPATIAGLRGDLRTGGLLFATVPSASGFEIQTLWDRSEALLPPDKLNLPSIAGLQLLFARPEWEILELSTPGMFDVESVRQAVHRDPGGPWPRFVRSLALESEGEGRTAFQEFLQRSRRASFARLLIRKAS